MVRHTNIQDDGIPGNCFIRVSNEFSSGMARPSSIRKGVERFLHQVEYSVQQHKDQYVPEVDPDAMNIDEKPEESMQFSKQTAANLSFLNYHRSGTHS